MRSRLTGGITIPIEPSPFELITFRAGPSRNSVDDTENVFGESFKQSFMVAFSQSSKWLDRFASVFELPLLQFPLLLFSQSSIDLVYWLLFAFILWLLPFALFARLALVYCCCVLIFGGESFGFWRVRFWSNRKNEEKIAKLLSNHLINAEKKNLGQLNFKLETGAFTNYYQPNHQKKLYITITLKLFNDKFS